MEQLWTEQERYYLVILDVKRNRKNFRSGWKRSFSSIEKGIRPELKDKKINKSGKTIWEQHASKLKIWYGGSLNNRSKEDYRSAWTNIRNMEH